ncbi:MAG: GntR family transcriptional regulator [Alphaproteobacteria bacterium]|nr:MAG: GntR family transcriptional regulator [Alphaproteobacteria bacterium]
MSKASARAYQAIRDAILSGHFQPGERLTEEELASACGVSRTPVRDALRVLASELYVTSVPNHGTFVTQWSIEDIETIFELRALLEGYGARRAAARIGAPQIAELETQADIIDAALQRRGGPDRDLFIDANRRFHDIVMEAARSERLTLMVHRLVQPPVVAQTATRYRKEDIARSNAHHREIIEALRTGDGRWAESVMTAHIHAAYRAYCNVQPDVVPLNGPAQPARR